MYRKKYGTPRAKIAPLSKRKCGGKKSNSKKHPYYGKPRRRPAARFRDWELFCLARGIKPEVKPEPVPEEDESDEEEVVELKDTAKVLKVEEVDLHIDENCEKHHTSKYGCTKKRTRVVDKKDKEFPAELVIRRGFSFKMSLLFSDPFDTVKNDITLSFFLDDEPSTKSNLQPTFKVDETGKKTYKKKWGASVIEKKGNSLTLDVFVPASAPVGEWAFSIRTTTEVKGQDAPLFSLYNHNDDINLIFNPWCKEDWVYLDDNDWRNETVLNDYGVQYRGSYRSMGGKFWFFGQFEDRILDAAFHLVRKGFGTPACPAMGNVAKVARILSQILNDCDDDGVLSGRWNGEYGDGVAPGEWAGSVRIIHKYMDTGKPVKYGQCWVFSALTTTICRALGMPCRSVTNFASAHNTDVDHLSIDKFTKTSGRDSGDSVWNFHVWNEVWMRRPDLSQCKEWDGWQVIDATPQERSGGVFCCGPAPVKAVKEGEIKIGDDCPFIFAEVNADRKTFNYDKPTNTYKELKFLRITDGVGKFVSTHKPTGEAFNGLSGSDEPDRDERLERYDLTDFYKYAEGSDKERQIVRKAEKMFKIMNGPCVYISDDEEEDEEEDDDPVLQPPIAIEIEQPTSAQLGKPFSFKVKATNMSQETIAIKDVVCRVIYKTYDDKEKGTAAIKKEKDIYLDGGNNKLYTVNVDEGRACARPEDGFLFDLRAEVSFYDGNVMQQEVDFRLRRPDVIIKGPENCMLGEVSNIELSFANPLNWALTKCKVTIDGGFDIIGLDDDIITFPRINYGGTWKQTIQAKPRCHPYGQKYRSLTVSFKSQQLEEIDGFLRLPLKSR